MQCPDLSYMRYSDEAQTVDTLCEIKLKARVPTAPRLEQRISMGSEVFLVQRPSILLFSSFGGLLARDPT